MNNNSKGVSIFNGVNEIIANNTESDGTLGFSYNPDVVPQLFEQILKNWRKHGRIKEKLPSQENWRSEQKIFISDHNDSREKILERAIARLARDRYLQNSGQWYNHVPVASGLINKHADKGAALDLVHIDGDSAKLIELKWASDTPVFALFEVLRYGLALLLSRMKATEFHYTERALIKATTVKLVVLAPAPYYSDHNSEDLNEFSETISKGLQRLSQKHESFPELSAQFMQFPADFELPFTSGAEVKNMTPEARECLKRAISSIQPIQA